MWIFQETKVTDPLDFENESIDLNVSLNFIFHTPLTSLPLSLLSIFFFRKILILKSISILATLQSVAGEKHHNHIGYAFKFSLNSWPWTLKTPILLPRNSTVFHYPITNWSTFLGNVSSQTSNISFPISTLGESQCFLFHGENKSR